MLIDVDRSSVLVKSYATLRSFVVPLASLYVATTLAA